MNPISPPDWGKLLVGPFLRALWPLYLLSGALILLQWFLLRHKRRQLLASRIEDLDAMSGRQFEEFLEALFLKLGYEVELTRYVGDYGADLVVRKDGVKTVVQAKRSKGRVGVKAIGEVLRAKGNYGSSAAMIITNSDYTRQAQEEAKRHGIVLWERNALMQKLLSVKDLPSPAITPPAVPLPEETASSVSPIVPALPQGVAAVCMVCGKSVSAKVQQYCHDHAERFGGQVYCFEHQRKRAAE
jgi:restriction system protein